MGVQIKQVEFSKELDDAMALVVAIVRDVKAGKPVADIATGNLQAFVEAMSGIDQVPAELAENRRAALQTIGYRTGELTDAFLG